jgi:hypothetical protein
MKEINNSEKIQKKKERKHMGLRGLLSLLKEELIESSSYTRGVRI